MSSVAPPSLPCTRLPGVTRWRLTRPVIGAITWAEFDIELGGLERAFGLHLRGARRLQGLAALVDDGIGHRLGQVQRQGTVEFALGEFCLRARVRQLAVGLLGDRLERTGVDHVKPDRPSRTMAPSRNSTLVTKPPTRART